MEKNCAFCRGSGRGVYRFYNQFSKCDVCQGAKKIAVEKNATTAKCAYCSGNGREKANGKMPCSACGGKGFGIFKGSSRQCPDCKGAGRQKENKLSCHGCGGLGRMGRIDD